MKIKRRIEIEVHTEKFSVTSLAQLTCAECGGQSRALTRDEAAGFAGTDLSTIDRLVETGKVHLAFTPQGLLVICLRSLASGGM